MSVGLIQPKEIDVDGKVFIISKFPAIAGREILVKYLTSNLTMIVPKISDYKMSEDLVLKMMSYVAVPNGASPPIRLVSQALVDNHVVCSENAEAAENLNEIERELLKYNSRFFLKEMNFNSLSGLIQKILQSIFKTLMDSSVQSLPKEKPPSMS